MLTCTQVLSDAERSLDLPFKARQLFTLKGGKVDSVALLNDLTEVVVGCGEPYYDYDYGIHCVSVCE